MGLNILFGCTMIIITTIIHSAMTRVAIYLNETKSKLWVTLQKKHIPVWLSLIVLLIFCATIIESVIWTICYLYIGAIGTMEEALYFSLVTFTTLGFGDIILSDNWRLLSSIQAVNGIIIFGWSTAILISTVQKLHRT